MQIHQNKGTCKKDVVLNSLPIMNCIFLLKFESVEIIMSVFPPESSMFVQITLRNVNESHENKWLKSE